MRYEIVLANGLRVVVIPSSALPLAHLRGAVRAGKYLDANPWVPILTSQLLMRGTTRYSRGKLEDYCDASALDVGFGDCGPLTVSASGVSPARFLDNLIEVFAHVLQNPSFPSEELAKAKQAAVAFIESQADSPEACAVAEGTRMLYTSAHPLFTPPSDLCLGYVDKVSLQDIRRFWETWYAPDRIAIAVVGDVDAGAVVSLACGAFGNWRQGQPPDFFDFASLQVLENRVSPPKAEERLVYIPEKSSALFWAGQALPITSSHPDYPALRIALGILGQRGSVTSRLFYEVREKRGYSYAIYASAEHIHEFPGFWQIVAHTNPDNIWKVRDEVFRVLDEFVALGVSEDEVRMMQAQLRGWRRVQRASLSGLAGEGILDFTTGQADFTQCLEDSIMRVSLEGVNAAIRKYINPSALAVVLAGTIEK